jgi:hypothetical protein
VSDGLGILLSLVAVIGPLILAWFLVVKDPQRRRPPRHPKRRTTNNDSN